MDYNEAAFPYERNSFECNLKEVHSGLSDCEVTPLYLTQDSRLRA